MDRPIHCHRIFRTGPPNHRFIALWWASTWTLWVFCINGNYPAPLCSRAKMVALLGARTSGCPSRLPSGGLSAHIIGAENGNFYRGQIGCDGTGYSMYKTEDGNNMDRACTASEESVLQILGMQKKLK